MAHPGGSHDVHLAMPKRRQVLAKRTRDERQRDRQALGRLRTQVVSPKTEERYLTAVSRFLNFLISHGKPYPSSFLVLDFEVSEFIEELWQQGDPKGWAGDCLSGLGHFIPPCKPCLVGSWRLHAAWGRAELPSRAPPFTPLLLYGLAQAAVNHGWVDLAVLLILGFHTFARAGELFQAKAGDFVLGSVSGTWTLPLYKSGQRQGVTESILITDPFVVVLLRNFLSSLSPGDPLSKVAGGTQRKRLNDLLLFLRIPFPFRMYSIRRGGATHAYRTTNNIAAICVKGRWNSVKTARLYICDAVAQLTELQLPEGTLRSLRRLALQCRPSFETAAL